MAHSESCFAFDTLFPPGTFVPPHIHTNQDEFIRVLEGQFDLFLDGQAATAKAGDLIRLPMGIAHGIFNKTEAPVRALFWVSPARGLYTLCTRIHNVPDPAEVVRLAAEHEVLREHRQLAGSDGLADWAIFPLPDQRLLRAKCFWPRCQ